MKKLGLTSVAAALVAVLVLCVAFWAGCDREDGIVTDPAIPDVSSEAPQSMAPAADADLIKPGEEIIDPEADDTVQECGLLGNEEGYYSFACPWADGWSGYSGSGSATMNKTTGVGTAYARCWPGNITRAWCGVRNAASGYAYRWTGPTRTAYVILKTPTKFAGTMCNRGGAKASVGIEVKEYLPTGQYSRTYSATVYWITTFGSFSKDLNGYGMSFPVKTNYLYATQVSCASYSSSGTTLPTGSYCDINPGQLKTFWFGY